MMIRGAFESKSDSSMTSTQASDKSSNQLQSSQINSGSQQSPSASGSGPATLMNKDSIEAQYLNELMNEEALHSFTSSQKHIYSTQIQNLTENDAEYIIIAVKHVFESVIILQYEIQNTLED